MIAHAKISIDDSAELHIHDGAALELERGEPFYGRPFVNQVELLEHLAVNLISEGARLSNLDGWADLPDGAVTVAKRDVNLVWCHYAKGDPR